MSTSGHVPDGTDLLTRELREEVGHLLTHPLEELKRLEHVAADGDARRPRYSRWAASGSWSWCCSHSCSG